MITFDEFVQSLGDDAGRYSPEELSQLDVDVQRIAQILVTIHRYKTAGRKRSQQAPVDLTSADRTINEHPIE